MFLEALYPFSLIQIDEYRTVRLLPLCSLNVRTRNTTHCPSSSLFFSPAISLCSSLSSSLSVISVFFLFSHASRRADSLKDRFAALSAFLHSVALRLVHFCSQRLRLSRYHMPYQLVPQCPLTAIPARAAMPLDIGSSWTRACEQLLPFVSIHACRVAAAWEWHWLALCVCMLAFAWVEQRFPGSH